jgi:hypothetical protein
MRHWGIHTMLIRQTLAGCLFVSVGATILLTGCASTPLSPTVQVTPGRGKTVEQFAAETTYCKQYAGDHVQGSVSNANGQALAAMLTRDQDDDSPPVLAASQQGNIQAEYDNAFGWCMFSEHNIVPGYGARRTRTVRAVHHTAPAADKATAAVPASTTWVAPTTAASSTGSSGWVAPAK